MVLTYKKLQNEVKKIDSKNIDKDMCQRAEDSIIQDLNNW